VPCSTLAKSQMIKNIPIFADLPARDLRAIAERAVCKVFPRHTILIVEGDRTDSLYVLIRGKVKVYLSDDQGKEVILNTLGPGEYFGELALLDEEPRSASVMTQEPTEVAIISKEDFDRCLSENPSIAINLIRVLSQRIRSLTGNVRDLALLDVYGRVTRLLLRLAEGKEGKLVIPQRLTHQEIANMVGASREMVTRIFRDLTSGGYITVTNKVIRINKKLPHGW
jgi:CRP/FNR family cyclic AMP-dependent transcriptional regulator